MKKYGNLIEKIADIANLELADRNARRHKTKSWGVLKHDRNRLANLEKLRQDLLNGTYKTSEYKTFTIYEPKERLIAALPYFPDRIGQHAILNILEPIWVKQFVSCTYACIKGRGIHGAYRGVKKSLQDVEGTKYCLKIDIKKCYASLDHSVLKQTIRKKIKDPKVLIILDEIIDSWEQIKDTFLLAAGDSYTAGSTGGEAEHKLTIDEMPSHTHRLKTDIESPDFNITWPEWTEYTWGWRQEESETIAPAASTTSTGGNKSHNNMPPYLTVYMWKRIS